MSLLAAHEECGSSSPAAFTPQLPPHSFSLFPQRRKYVLEDRRRFASCLFSRPPRVPLAAEGEKDARRRQHSQKHMLALFSFSVLRIAHRRPPVALPRSVAP